MENSNTLAIVGFVLSFIIPIAGLICSIIGYKRAKEYGLDHGGLALSGIIISSLAIGAVLVVVIF